MTQTSPLRLHMGCGESLLSQWLLSAAPAERKTPAASRKPTGGKRKWERTRG